MTDKQFLLILAFSLSLIANVGLYEGRKRIILPEESCKTVFGEHYTAIKTNQTIDVKIEGYLLEVPKYKCKLIEDK